MFLQKSILSHAVFFSLACFVLSFIAIACAEDGESTASTPEKGNGLGEAYNWVSLEDGKVIAKEEKKPLMIIIHKSWCGACKSLKPKFAKSKSILKLSKHFVMVNTLDDEEPKGDIYTPDGGYIPRILYFDSEGSLLDVINEGGNPDYKYYYPDPKSIAESMKNALKKLSIEYEEKGEKKESSEGDKNDSGETGDESKARTEL